MTPEPAQTKADYRIKEVHLQEEGRGATRWQLDAEYGEIFEDQGRTTMKKVVVRVEEPTSGVDGQRRRGRYAARQQGRRVARQCDPRDQ